MALILSGHYSTLTTPTRRPTSADQLSAHHPNLRRSTRGALAGCLSDHSQLERRTTHDDANHSRRSWSVAFDQDESSVFFVKIARRNDDHFLGVVNPFESGVHLIFGQCRDLLITRLLEIHRSSGSQVLHQFTCDS